MIPQSVRLVSMATANPETRWRQDKILESVQGNPRVSGHAQLFYKRFLSDKGIETRHFGMPDLQTVNTESPDEANRRFAQVATELGTEAAIKCLHAAELNPEQLDGLIITTCTGYLCPGLTSYISESLKLRENIFSLDLVGLGCGAALPALRAAQQYLQTHSASRVLVLCVEVCSAALSWGDEIDLILSNALFSDGAAACLLSNCDGEQGCEILHYESLLWPEYRDDLRFQSHNARLRNVINRTVPDIAAEAVKQLADKLRAVNERPFDHYGVHPGGRRVLDEIQTALGLDSERLASSRAVLRRYGNMSSPSILFVLKNMIEQSPLKAGQTAALFSFGAGFSAYGMTLRKTDQSSVS